MGRLTALQDLYIDLCDDLQGTIPTEIGLLIDLRNLWLSGSRVQGTIPDELYNIKELLTLDLGGCLLSGTISSKIENFRNLSWFSVSSNDISGSIPEEIFSLDDLYSFHLNGNTKLYGSIPERFCARPRQRLPGAHRAVVADCMPTASTGVPSVLCPNDCCSMCCDSETKICLPT